MEQEQPTSNSQRAYVEKEIRLAAKATLSESMNLSLLASQRRRNANHYHKLFFLLPTLLFQPTKPPVNQ